MHTLEIAKSWTSLMGSFQNIIGSENCNIKSVQNFRANSRKAF